MIASQASEAETSLSSELSRSEDETDSDEHVPVKRFHTPSLPYAPTVRINSDIPFSEAPPGAY